MKNNIFFSSLLMMFAVCGCVKDDNPLPDIDKTSWKRVSGEDWERLSFRDGRVYCQKYEKGSLSDYYADCFPGSEDGQHFYTWSNDEIEMAYRVYSAGPQYIIVRYSPKEYVPIGFYLNSCLVFEHN